MKYEILDCTVEALTGIVHPRLFESERGYCGQFNLEMCRALDKRGMLEDKRRLLETEYQKTEPLHGIRQRPDIVFHIPVEVSEADRRENNFAVWAFKLCASREEAAEDFDKLDQMFEYLNYPLGFFINIGRPQNWLDVYRGKFADRLYSTGVVLNGSQAVIDLSHIETIDSQERG